MSGPAADGPARGAQILKAGALIVVLVAVGVAVLYRSGRSHVSVAAALQSPRGAATTPVTTTPPPAPTTTTTTLPPVPPSQVKVQVLNGVLTGALAGEWSTKLHSRYGYITEPPDNATTSVTASTIYVITPNYVPEAMALASEIGLPASDVDATIPPPLTAPIPPSERGTANLVLVIGPELSASG